MKLSEEQYNKMSVSEIVQRIITEPFDEEAAYYLIHHRYKPLVCKCCIKVFNNLQWEEDCEHDLFIYLKGKDQTWKALRDISDKKSITAWMNQTVYRRMMDIKPKLVEKWKNTISLDEEVGCKRKVNLPDKGNEEYEKQEARLQIIEAIPYLKDRDQKLVIIKTIKGYSSKDIAEMLKKKWEKEGFCKIDKGKIVVPTASYINVLRQRAKIELKKIINQNL